jgi:hypothetical protein
MPIATAFMGCLPIDSREAYLFFQFISYRYEKNSTIITSNKNFSDWQELFADLVIAPPSWTGCCITARWLTSKATATGCASTILERPVCQRSIEIRCWSGR